MLAPVAIRAARSMGAQVVIAVDVSAYLERTPAEAPESWRLRDRKRTAMIAAEMAEADVFIHPDLGYYAAIAVPYRQMCIRQGELAAREALPAIRAALAKLGRPPAKP